MPQLEWRHLDVELVSPDALVEGCRILSGQGWTPVFIVPVIHNRFQIIANRQKKEPPPMAPRPGEPRPDFLDEPVDLTRVRGRR